MEAIIENAPQSSAPQPAAGKTILEVNNIEVVYDEVILVLRGVSLTVPEGEIVALLGPNGAGKSTTMRMMVGLTPPSSGTAQVCGAAYADLPNPPREVGVLLDASAQHAGRTGREILTIAAMTAGLPRSRAAAMLDLVSLTEEEADLVPVLRDVQLPTVPIFFVFPEELKTAKKVQVFRDFLVAKARQWKF